LAILIAATTAITARGIPAQPPPPRTGEEIVQNTCILCHGAGLSGAPRIGSARDWRERLVAGLDGLVRSAASGKGAMPARGGMPDLTEAELRAAISYMSGAEDVRIAPR